MNNNQRSKSEHKTHAQHRQRQPAVRQQWQAGAAAAPLVLRYWTEMRSQKNEQAGAWPYPKN
jgi:hypothetical protein